MTGNKERVGSDRSTGKTQKEISPFVNGLIMRTVGYSRLLFASVSDMQKTLKMLLGISEKEFWLSVSYLTEMDYLVQFIDGKSKMFLGDQLGVTYKGAGLLAGAIKDNKVIL